MSAALVEAPVKARPEVPSAIALDPWGTHCPGTWVAWTAAALAETEALMD